MLQQLFLELFRVALGSASQLSLTPTAADWSRLHELARLHTVTGLFFSGVERLPADQRPPKEVLLAWYMETERIKALNARVNRDAATLTARLTREGWAGVVLKGQGVARYYDRPEVRMPGDIDYYVRSSMSEFISYLRRTAKGPLRVQYKDTVYPTEEETEVEMHHVPAVFFCPWAEVRFRRFTKACGPLLGGEPVALPNGAGTINVPGRTFNAVFLLLHIYHHIFEEGIGWRQVADFYYFLRNSGLTPEERAEAVGTLRRVGMLRFTKGMMHVLHARLGLPAEYLLTPPDEAEGRFVFGEIMRGGNFSRFEGGERKVHKSQIGHHLSTIRHNLPLLRHYPQEMLWQPLFHLWHFAWRQLHGYRN